MAAGGERFFIGNDALRRWLTALSEAARLSELLARSSSAGDAALHQEFPNATMNFSHFLLSVSQRVRSP